MKKRNLLVVGLAVMLSACGFQLRGTGDTRFALKEIDADDRIHRQNIAGDNSSRRADLLDHILRPAAGRRTQIYHGHTGFEKLVTLLYFIKFKPGARTQPLFLCLKHIFIAKVFL